MEGASLPILQAGGGDSCVSDEVRSVAEVTGPASRRAGAKTPGRSFLHPPGGVPHCQFKSVLSVSCGKNSWEMSYALIMLRKDQGVCWFGGNVQKREVRNCNSHESL